MLWLCIRNFALWIAVGVVTVFIIKGTSIGEVILTISASRGWGIHTFDLIVFPIGLLAIAFTVLDYIIFTMKEKTALEDANVAKI